MTMIRAVLASWLDKEASKWQDQEGVLEGACSWSPLFLSRLEDIMLGASNTVKLLGEHPSRGPVATELIVFGQVYESRLFQGFCRVLARLCNSR